MILSKNCVGDECNNGVVSKPPHFAQFTSQKTSIEWDMHSVTSTWYIYVRVNLPILLEFKREPLDWREIKPQKIILEVDAHGMRYATEKGWYTNLSLWVKN